MSNTAILNEKVLYGVEVNCPKCKNLVENIVSDTNSHYFYCNSCDYNKEIIEKHMAFDTILKKIQNYVLEMMNNNIDEIKVSLSNDKDKVLLRINNDDLVSTKFTFKLRDIDKKLLNYTIEELIDDSFRDGVLKSKVDIVI